MNYYSTLGLNQNASQDEIKAAYRKMAMKHHPDRGGDEKKFKEIEEAYRTLSDPQKKQMFDMGVDPNGPQGQGGFGFHQGPFEFHFGSNNWNDIFGGGFGFPNRQPRNKTINIVVELSIEEVLTGKILDAEISIPNGKKKIINVNIPAGIDDGQQIRYQGLGDNSIPGIPAGDLIVNIRVVNRTEFRRDGDSLLIERHISIWDAILGCTIDIVTIDGKNLQIAVPPGTQSETILSCKNEGLPNMKTRQRGNLLLRIRIHIPRNLTSEQKQKIEKLKNEL